MGIREWMNENSSIVTIGAVVLLVVALAVVIMQSFGSGSGRPSEAWYMDTETGDIFSDSNDLIAPIESPEGNEAVRVYYFTCGKCNEEERFIGYLEKYTPKAKEAMEAIRSGNGDYKPGQEELMMTGQLYKTKDGERWASSMGRGQNVLNYPTQKCKQEGGQVRVCLP